MSAGKDRTVRMKNRSAAVRVLTIIHDRRSDHNREAQNHAPADRTAVCDGRGTLDTHCHNQS